jgi:hypothetical protein
MSLGLGFFMQNAGGFEMGVGSNRVLEQENPVMFVKVVVNLRVKGRYEKACEHFLYMVY